MPLPQIILPTPRPLDMVGGASPPILGAQAQSTELGGACFSWTWPCPPRCLWLDVASSWPCPPFTCPPGPSQYANLISSHHSAPLRGLPWALETPGTKARVLPRSISPTVLLFGSGPSCLWFVTSARSSPTTHLRAARLHPQGHHSAPWQSHHWETPCARTSPCLTRWSPADQQGCSELRLKANVKHTWNFKVFLKKISILKKKINYMLR